MEMDELGQNKENDAFVQVHVQSKTTGGNKILEHAKVPRETLTTMTMSAQEKPKLKFKKMWRRNCLICSFIFLLLTNVTLGAWLYYLYASSVVGGCRGSTEFPEHWLLAAVVRVDECGEEYKSEEYNATRDGNCKTFDGGIDAVELLGTCVTVYQNADCSGTQFQLNTHNKDEGHLIPQHFPYTNGKRSISYHNPKSIGPCSKWSNEQVESKCLAVRNKPTTEEPPVRSGNEWG